MSVPNAFDERSESPLVTPLLRALQLVAREGRKHAAAGNDDTFVAVARICTAALLWRKADLDGDFESAQRYADMIP